jgi:hypothetical protein
MKPDTNDSLATTFNPITMITKVFAAEVVHRMCFVASLLPAPVIVEKAIKVLKFKLLTVKINKGKTI